MMVDELKLMPPSGSAPRPLLSRALAAFAGAATGALLATALPLQLSHRLGIDSGSGGGQGGLEPVGAWLAVCGAVLALLGGVGQTLTVFKGAGLKRCAATAVLYTCWLGLACAAAFGAVRFLLHCHPWLGDC